MKKTQLALSLLLMTSALSLPSLAQTSSDNNQARVDRLERDVQLLQRQLARGEPVNIAPSAGGADQGAPTDSSLEVRLSAIEEQLRTLSGKNEENEFQIKKLQETLDKQQKDTDFRFNEIQNSASGGPTPPAPAHEERKSLPENDGNDKPTPIGKSDKPDKNDDVKPDTTGASTAGDGTLRLPDKGNPKDGNFATPREHYNYAFRLLNQTQYEEAAKSFDAFTKKYPKDPLVGNAFYWEGETYYIRRDYVNAADNFRQGFEALPDGPKAADNLLKLAMSLNALNRDKEACVVLQQIVTKFKKNSTSVTDKADQEQKRIGCH